MKRRWSTALIMLLAGCQPAAQLPGSDFEGPAFEFEEVMPDIYHARGTGAVAVGANAAIVVNEEDVLIVDSHVSPAAAQALLDELRDITDKPVRYMVNTHYHLDHAHGNQIFGPEVQVIGHEVTRAMLRDGASLGRAYELMIGPLPEVIEQLRQQIATAVDDSTRQALASRLAYQERYLAGQEGLVVTPPNTTLSERMTLFRGDREIRLLFFGRGHTGGDVVVHLPQQRVLITGDLLTAGLPYMGESFPVEWVETLEHLKRLDFDWVLPGHGPAFGDPERVDHLQAYLRDLWARASEAHARGLTVEQAAQQIDMTDHVEHYPSSIRGPGVPQLTMLRVWELLGGRGGQLER